LLSGNETDDDEDDLDLKFDNLRTDYPEEYQSSAFVRLMFWDCEEHIDSYLQDCDRF
jgi:hypothetical protein